MSLLSNSAHFTLKDFRTWVANNNTSSAGVESMMLAAEHVSAAVDVQICQCCEPGEFPVTTRAVISKGILP